MTKKILAVLLAICMITGTCVLFASAAGETISVDKEYTTDEINNKRFYKNGTAFTEFTGSKNITVTLEKSSSPSLSSGDSKITSSNVDGILTFKVGGTEEKFTKTISTYIGVDGNVTASGNTASANVTFSDLEANYLYQIDSSNLPTSPDSNSKYTYKLIKSGDTRYQKPANIKVDNIARTINLCAVTIGVRFYGDNTENLVNDEIAKVNAVITRQSGAVNKTTTGVVNKISDLIPGDQVVLSTELKNPVDDKEYYAFNCWVDSNGKVLGTDPSVYTINVTGNTAVYACYVELKPRFVISYTSATNSQPADGSGDGVGGSLIVVSNANKAGKVIGREVYQGDAQISVMQGKDFDFTIQPKDGYEIAHVYVKRGGAQPKTIDDFDYDVASFRYLVMPGSSLKNLAELIKATGANRSVRRETGNQGVEGSYTFEDVEQDCWIHVVFEGIKLIEEPSGLAELPPAELGMELEGGPEGPEGAEPGAAAAAATTVPAENGVAGAGAAVGGVVNPATGSESAIAVFAVMTAAACAAFVTMKKKKD